MAADLEESSASEKIGVTPMKKVKKVGGKVGGKKVYSKVKMKQASVKMPKMKKV